MNVYEVTIKATIIKTYKVKGADSDDAVTNAIENFSVLVDDADEHYEQEVLDIIQLGESK